MATTRLITADDLLTMDLPPGRIDLIDGELLHMPPAGQEHGDIQVNIFLPMANYVVGNGLGRIYVSDTGFLLSRDPDVVVAPEIAFVRREHIERIGRRKGYVPLTPDLAVEIVSPNDYPKLIEQKVAKYLAAGIRVLVVVYPDQRRVRVHGAGRAPYDLGEADVFDGGDVLPGFALPVADIFR